MASRKTTANCDFSYEPEEWALYGERSEKRLEFVAGDVDGGRCLWEKIAAFGSSYREMQTV
jgi:hypothetical protein